MDATFPWVARSLIRNCLAESPLALQIDPELPQERKAYISRDSGARFVLTTSDLSSADLFGPNALFLDSTEVLDAIDREESNEFNIAKPENLSYMLYTSGWSTVFAPCHSY